VILIQPYRMSSKSARLIAEMLGVKRINMNASTYNPKSHHTVINWGSHRVFPYVQYVNHPEKVQVAANKLSSMRAFKQKHVSTVEWTTNAIEANQWVNEGHVVFARTLLNSSEGKGIVVVNQGSVPDAPLYTKYKKKKKEFRVHVFDGTVISVQEKRKRKDYNGTTNAQIRSYRHGWVFCRENVVEPADLRSVAQQAIKALGLHFGAVDIIWNALDNVSYVLEVNTAPGVEGSSTDIYAQTIKAYLQKQQNAPSVTVDFLV